MNNEEVKEGISHLEMLLNYGILSSEDEPHIKTVLNYIEELEKDNKELRKYYSSRKEVEELKDTIKCLHESSKEYINKQKIRDKIEDLKSYKGLVMYEKYNYEAIIKHLQDLLGE